MREMATFTHTIDPPSTVLVTGGTGFLGAYVIRELVLAGYAVRAIRRASTLPFYIDPRILEQVEWMESDIHDPVGLEASMRGADAVVHCAAKVSFQPRERPLIFKTNIEGTANVVNMALETGIGKLIHVSSVASLGKKNDGLMLDEDVKWINNAQQTSYAISKYHGEMEVWRGIAEGLNATIVNPSTILGYGDWTTSSCALFRNVYKGFPWYTNGVNGFVDVADVAVAIVKLLQSNLHSERFILNSENRSYRSILNSIADGFGRKRPSMEATPLLASLAWRMEKIKSFFGKPVTITRENAKVARSNTRYSNNKILHALKGFTFTPVEETIRKACYQYANAL